MFFFLRSTFCYLSLQLSVFLFLVLSSGFGLSLGLFFVFVFILSSLCVLNFSSRTSSVCVFGVTTLARTIDRV